MNEDLTLNPIQEDMNDVLSNSSVVNNSRKKTPDLPNGDSFRNGIIKDLNEQTAKDFEAQEVIKPNDKGYVGTNSEYRDVVPFKLNVFGEDITANRADPRKIAYDFLVNHKGYPAEDYIGYTYAPYRTDEGWASALANGFASAAARAPSAVGGVMSGIIDAYVLGRSFGEDEKTKEYLRDRAQTWTKAIETTMNDFSEKLQNKWANEAWMGTFGNELLRGIGSGSFSILAMALSGGAAPLTAAVLNGETYNNIKNSRMDDGVSYDGAVSWGLSGASVVSALDAFSFGAINKGFKGVTARILGKTSEELAEKLTEKQIAKQVALAGMSKKQVLGRGFLKGIGGSFTEGTTEYLQNVTEDYASGAIGRNPHYDFFKDENTIAALSGFILGAVGIPGHLSEAVVNRDKAILANTLSNAEISGLLSTYDAAKEYLVSSGKLNEEQATEFLKLLLEKEKPAEVLSELQTTIGEQVDKFVSDPSDLKSFMARLEDIKNKKTDISEDAFKVLDDKVRQVFTDKNGKLRGAVTETDVLRAQGIMRGIASWMLLTKGIGPKEFADSKMMLAGFEFTKDSRDAGYMQVYPFSQVLGLASRYLDPDKSRFVDAWTSEGYGGLRNRDATEAESVMSHELAHLLYNAMRFAFDSDKNKVPKEFLDVMFSTIESVFGKGKAEKVRADMSVGMGRAGSYASTRNTTEYFAQAVGLIKENTKNALGITGKPAEFLNFANMVLNGMALMTEVPAPIQAYLDAVKSVSKDTGTRLVAMAEKHGVENLSSAVQQAIDKKSLDIKWKTLDAEALKELYDLSTEFTDGRGTEILKQVFQTEEKLLDFRNVAEIYYDTAHKRDMDAKLAVESIDKRRSEIMTEMSGLEMTKKYEKDPKKVEEATKKLEPLKQELDVLNSEKDVLAQKVKDILSSGSVLTEKQDRSILPETHNPVTEMSGEGMNAEQLSKAMEDTVNAEKKDVEKNGTFFERQIKRKIGGKTLVEHLESAKNLITEKATNGPLSKFYKFLLKTKVQFGVEEYIWALFGDNGVKEFDILGKHEAFDNLNIAFHDNFTARIQKEVLGKSKTKSASMSASLQKFENECSIRKYDVEYLDPAGRVIEKKKLTAFEVMNMYLVAKQNKRPVDADGVQTGAPSPKERLQKSFPNQNIDDIINQLTPEQKKYADIMGEEVSKAYDRMRAAFKTQGIKTEMPTVENYWMLLDALHQELDSDYTLVTIARNIYADSALGVMDAREQFNRYMSRVAGIETEYYTTLHRLKDLLFFKPTQLEAYEYEAAKDIIDSSHELFYKAKQRLGEDGMKSFEALLDDHLQNRTEKVLSDSFLSKIARNITSSILSWKPIQFVKNTSNFFSFWGLADNQAQYWSDTLKGMTSPKETWDFMVKTSPLIAKRMRGLSYSEYLNSTTSGGDNITAAILKMSNEKEMFSNAVPALNNFVALTNIMKKVGLSPMIYGDAMANIYGGYALLQQYIKKNGGDIQTAVKEFESAILHRQSNSNQALKSLAYRQMNRNVLGNILAFTSEGVQKWNNMFHDIESAMQGEKTWGQASRSIASNAMSMMVFALISCGVWDALSDDDDKEEAVRESFTTELLSSAVGASMFGNSMIMPAVRQLYGDRTSTSQMSLVSELSSATKSIYDGDAGMMMARSAELGGLFIGAPNLLNEFRGISRYATATTDEEKRAGIKQALGRSESYANKREGIKKDKRVENE